jgi:hypothetical protein
VREDNGNAAWDLANLRLADADRIRSAELSQRLKLGPHKEKRCPRCDRRTRDKTGVCSTCRWVLPDLKRLTNEQLMGLGQAVRAEAERRKKALEEVLG